MHKELMEAEFFSFLLVLVDVGILFRYSLAVPIKSGDDSTP